MHLDLNLNLKQRQALQVSTQLIQSLKILQFSHNELTRYLEDEAERNPLIDVALPCLSVLEEPANNRAQVNDVDFPLPSEKPHFEPERRNGSDISPSNSLNGGLGSLGAGGRQSRDSMIDIIQSTYSASITLREHLLSQVALTFRDISERKVAEQIVESIEGDGYLRTPLGLIADLAGSDLQTAEKVLKKVQGFEPTGVGARNLVECLRPQLEERGLLCCEMELVLKNLPLLARFEYSKIASVIGANVETVQKLAKEIRGLNPKPGSLYDNEPVQAALPEIIVRISPDSEISVELNGELMPRVLLDRKYYAEISEQRLEKEVKRCVNNWMQSGSWLVKNLDQRAQTLLVVATEIARQQKEFLLNGVEYLRPLSLKDVAKDAGVHESTVCRAIANKFMMTPFGMFELSYFFSNAISSTQAGEVYSAETVREKIRLLIEKETLDTVLSDEAIVSALQDRKIKVARRTVAKYRDMLRLPPASQRRREIRCRSTECAI